MHIITTTKKGFVGSIPSSPHNYASGWYAYAIFIIVDLKTENDQEI